jgi:hypothetical protein
MNSHRYIDQGRTKWRNFRLSTETLDFLTCLACFGCKQAAGYPNMQFSFYVVKILPTLPVTCITLQGCRPWVQILADKLTLCQPEGTDYAHLITTGTSTFSDLLTAPK